MLIDLSIAENQNNKIEPRNWGEFLRRLSEEGTLDIGKKTAIIIDWKRQAIEEFNRGKEFTSESPFNKLPESFKFIYSKDSKYEAVQKMMIKRTDRIADYVLREIKSTFDNWKQGDEKIWLDAQKLAENAWNEFNANRNLIEGKSSEGES